MTKLIKYELRKNLFSKLILLAIIAVTEVLFLSGIFFEWETGMVWGIIGLSMSAVIGIFYIGIESLLTLHKDLNTKQSYMLFLTPQNSYQILGAKIIENGISIFLTGIFFAVLASLDVSIAVLRIGGLEQFLEMLRELAISFHVEVDIYADAVLMTFFSVLASWLLTIVNGFLAIILCATVLAGKKLSGLVSFILFGFLVWLSGIIINLLPPMDNLNLRAMLLIASSIILITVIYAISSWIMERKLSV